MTREDIIARLSAFPYGMDGFWLTAGAALVMFGVREETEDIDMGCTSALADRLEADGFLFQITADGSRWFKLGSEIEVFENWLFDSVEYIDGFPVMSLRGLREMKQQLGREKDLRDIRLIDAWIMKVIVP